MHAIEICYKPDAAIKTKEFWILWFVFFVNIACGIALLSIAAPMGERLGMSAIEAAGMVGMVGLLNGGGRIFFAAISDYTGRRIVYEIFFFTEAYAFLTLSTTNNVFLFQSLLFVVVACYGGGFSCMPSYLSDLFGTKYISTIHGRILTAWGLAGIAGPLILTKCFEITGNYTTALEIFSALFIISYLAMGFMKPSEYDGGKINLFFKDNKSE
jgi:OFA family oxalate/formate antiporter-like MFS transporter